MSCATRPTWPRSLWFERGRLERCVHRRIGLVLTEMGYAVDRAAAGRAGRELPELVVEIAGLEGLGEGLEAERPGPAVAKVLLHGREEDLALVPGHRYHLAVPEGLGDLFHPLGNLFPGVREPERDRRALTPEIGLQGLCERGVVTGGFSH